MKYTTNYEFKNPEGSDKVKRQDLISDNIVAIDEALTPSVDETVVLPTKAESAKLNIWISWLTNRIKAITGKDTWWDNPIASIESLYTERIYLQEEEPSNVNPTTIWFDVRGEVNFL